MKTKIKYSVLLIIGFAFTHVAYSQEPVDVNVVTEQAANGEQSFFIVNIPQATIKDVRESWQQYVRKSSEGKASAVNEQYIQEGMVIKSISSDPFIIYGYFSERTDGVQLKAWLTQNDVPFPLQGQNNSPVIQFVREFAVKEYHNAVEDELKMEQDKLEEMEKRLSAIDKTEDKSLKAIEKNTKENEKSQTDVQNNTADLQATAVKIDEQKDMIEVTAPDPNANKGAKKTMREIKKEKKDIKKKTEKERRIIDKRDEETRELERKVETQKMSRQSLMDEIAAQKQVVSNVQTKLENIEKM